MAQQTIKIYSIGITSALEAIDLFVQYKIEAVVF